MSKKLNKADKHVIAILVDNEFGALARIVGLFSARGYNIETLSVAVVDEKNNLSRITITTYGSQDTIDLITKLLERIIPVHKAQDLNSLDAHIERGLALIKVAYDNKNREEILRIADIYEARLVGKSKTYFIFETTNEHTKIEIFIKMLEPFNILEISRTGSAALALSDDVLQKN
jgi:acetolactate synthase I/III small subunit